MSDLDAVIKALLDHGISPAGAVIRSPAEEKGFFVPIVSVIRNGVKYPSGQTLRNAQTFLLSLGCNLYFIISDEQSRGTEENLRTSLLSAFPDDVRSCYFSTGNGKPQVWIDLKRAPTAEITRRLKEHVSKFADVFSIKELTMAPLGEANAPTKSEILRSIRHYSPIDADSLAANLTAEDHELPSEDWLNRRLDALRKTGLGAPKDRREVRPHVSGPHSAGYP